ncbi:sigma-70 family RNA polymerase sigma factor [Streptomyces sp. WMMC500]|uniref:RNA polymerase sigma factor n=1 Tax=Streptomyces sp. WMMC500 TaxID=3015154 RepID=UPI00248D2719|nr:sigma-70 family RNA polymerase sigma factor [Streptomyces sp. WMMC500]WBB63546.1 sigma-70 family RNA polymerase sigma factor [Streptomyces sp. WMMC500]
MTEPDDAERFTAIYDECRQRVWAYAAAHAGRQRADEVVSETFAVAWRRIRDLPEPPLPWLLGVARIQVRSAARAAAKQAAREALLEPQAGWETEDVADVVTERMTVLRALAALDADDREVLILMAWQGLDQRAAAQVLGCTQVAFRVRLHRARKRLARALETVAQDAHRAGAPHEPHEPHEPPAPPAPDRRSTVRAGAVPGARAARPAPAARTAGEDPR